jgi:glycosyltransferase involved in cell wall biosynthesis
MISNQIKISVIIPCYNQGLFLKEACDSLINQTFTDFEVIIVNDGSIDETEKIALSICNEDSRFSYYSKENGGLSSARNFGLKHASGNFIQFLDSDDKLDKNKFEASIDFLNKNKIDIVITDFLRFKSKNGKEKKVRFDLNKQIINYKSVLLKWDIEFAIPIHCALFSKNIIGDIQFEENLKAKEDWFYWLSVLKRSPNIHFINEKLALYRAHKQNMSKNNDKMFLNEKVANEIIYESLEDEYKNVFFKRLNNELLKSKLTYHDFKDKLFSRRFLSFLKA